MKRLTLILAVAAVAILSYAAISNFRASATTAPAASTVEEARVASLTTQLRSENAAERTNAANALAGVESREATTALLANLGDSDPTAGYAAAQALGQSQSPVVVDSLVAELDNAEPATRQRAAVALREMNAAVAVPALANALSDSATSTIAAEALVKINNPAAQDALLVALADRELTTRRHAAMAAIEQADAATSQHLLGRALASEDLVLRSNAMTLRDMMAPR